MRFITTVNDVIQWLDDCCQDDQSRDGESHRDVLQRTGRQLWAEGHIDGLRSRDDWSEWLDAVDFDEVAKFMDGTVAQITPDGDQ
jgi:hypothetical protein